jgi:hypothetical protein
MFVFLALLQPSAWFSVKSEDAPSAAMDQNPRLLAPPALVTPMAGSTTPRRQVQVDPSTFHLFVQHYGIQQTTYGSAGNQGSTSLTTAFVRLPSLSARPRLQKLPIIVRPPAPSLANVPPGPQNVPPPQPLPEGTICVLNTEASLPSSDSSESTDVGEGETTDSVQEVFLHCRR